MTCCIGGNLLLTGPVNSLPNAERIESIRVTDYSGPLDTDSRAFKTFDDVRVTVHAYELHSAVNESALQGRRVPQHISNEGPGRITILPSEALAGTWDSLVFEDFDPAQILRSIARISIYSFMRLLNCFQPTDRVCSRPHETTWR